MFSITKWLNLQKYNLLISRIVSFKETKFFKQQNGQLTEGIFREVDLVNSVGLVVVSGDHDRADHRFAEKGLVVLLNVKNLIVFY